MNNWTGKWVEGDRVRIQQARPGDGTDIHGEGVVASLSGNISLSLKDGSRWRYRDGYAWGSVPTKGVGRKFERQIVKIVAGILVKINEGSNE
jgi:hypothetical protein